MAVVHACTTAAKQSCENYIGPLARTYTRTHALMHTQTHTHTHMHTRAHTPHTQSWSPPMPPRYRALGRRRKRGFKVLVTKQDLILRPLLELLHHPTRASADTNSENNKSSPRSPLHLILDKCGQCQCTFEAETKKVVQ